MTTSASAAYLALVGTPPKELRRILLRGEAPDPAKLVGWEYRGTNMPATSRVMGLRRFIKGFTATAKGIADGGIEGYNKQVAGADLGSPWTPRPQRDGRVAFARFAVAPVDPESVDNRFLHALLFDYGAVADPEPGIAGHLRDYVVRVVPGSDDLLLGRAYAALGSVRVAVGWFALERVQV
ncbi:hypothetical protein BH20ACT2_BH20ACT2_15500 [soil metagenome]